MILEDPEIYDEDGTQRIITTGHRRYGNPVQYNLIHDGHWLNQLKDTYGAMVDLKNSGRIYNGSDVILNNIEGEMFRDPNQIYQFKSTIESSYIYIISKVIGPNHYYKVGEGGSGRRSKVEDEISSGKKKGPGRLGDANTFLPFGLNDDVGFRVHYLFFFEKRHHPNVDEFLNMFIEKRLHANLRYNFRSASISMESGRPSEWYLIPDNDLPIFLGFIFDIVSSYKIRPLEIWKLTSDSVVPKVKIKLDFDWIARMKKNPQYNELENVVYNIGTNIVVKQNFTEEIGNIQLFFDELKGGFTLPIKRVSAVAAPAAPLARRGRGTAAAVLPAPKMLVYNVVEIVKNKRSHGEGNPLQLDGFYGIVTNKERTFGQNKDAFLLLGLKSGVIFEDRLSEQDIADGIKSKFYIGILDLLEIHKKTKYWKDSLFRTWALKDIYNYYSNTAEYKEEVYEMPNNFLVPPWFYNTQIQLAWAAKMTTEEEFMYHTDCVKNYSNHNHKYNWKSIRFFPEQGMNYVIERARIDADKIIIPNTNEAVPVIRVMNAMAVNEIKPTGKIKKEKQHKVPLKQCSVGKVGEVVVILKPGNLIELHDDYFTHTRNGETDDIRNHTGKTVYAVKKIYTKTDHSVDLNPWIDVQQYPSTVDKRIFSILISDFDTDELKGKLTMKAKTPSAITKLKKKLDDEDTTVMNDLETELRRAKAPMFKKDDIIRIKPEEFIMSGKNFGEDETKRNEYHYAKILKRVKQGRIDVQYEIAYFDPWDKNEPWGLTPEQSGYTERHIISIVDRYAEKVEEDDESFLQYKTNLEGRYAIDTIYDHSPKRENVNTHEEFMASVTDDETAYYYVRWTGYPPDTDNEVAAIGLYEDLPDDVRKYWKRRQPYRMETRAQTRRRAAAEPPRVVGGGRKTRKSKINKTTRKNTKNQKGRITKIKRPH